MCWLAQDNLTMAAMRFLTTVARGVAAKLFSAGDALTQICQSIILPNRELIARQWHALHGHASAGPC